MPPPRPRTAPMPPATTEVTRIASRKASWSTASRRRRAPGGRARQPPAPGPHARPPRAVDVARSLSRYSPLDVRTAPLRREATDARRLGARGDEGLVGEGRGGARGLLGRDRGDRHQDGHGGTGPGRDQAVAAAPRRLQVVLEVE